MMKPLRLAVLLTGALCLAGCEKPIQRRATDNPDITASLLATVDGCRVWSVPTGARTIYVTRCLDANPGSTEWDESCGKGCTERQQTITGGGRR